MIALVFVALATFFGGHGASEALWRRERAAGDLGAFERAASSGVLGLALWIGASWVLAVPRVLNAASLLGVVTIVAAAGVYALWRDRRRTGSTSPSAEFGGADAAVRAAAILALGLWLAYVGWRALVTFVMNHDGLAYHMPRALLLAQNHGYAVFDGADERMSVWPANYEILLADVILLDHSDRLTGWIGPIGFVLLLVVVAAMAQRWWGRGLHVLAGVLVCAAMPVLLVHTGAHKNDVLMGALVLAAAHFGARWSARGESPALALCVVALALAVGTKLQGLLLGAVLLPVVLAGAWRRRRAGTLSAGYLLAACGLGALAFLLLGGAAYAINWAATGRPFALVKSAQGGLGDWSNLWMYPYLVLTAPFSPRAPTWVWAPWAGSYWFAPQHDLFFSNFGMPISLLLAALPFAVWRYRARAPGPAAAEEGASAGPGDTVRLERAVVCAVLLAAALLMLPLKFRPVGLFMSCTRYVLFLPVAVVLWTVVPAIRDLGARSAAAAQGAVLVLTGMFGYAAVMAALRDAYMPWDFVSAAADHPELGRTIFSFPYRAESAVDQMAAPDDHVAIDGAYDSWVYPAYGRDLRRTVTYLHSDRGPVEIPDDVRWVVVDRAWNCWFGHPDFKDLGSWNEHIGQGKPLPEDLVVFHQLAHDPRFKLVYRQKQFNQAVFQRRPPGEGPAPAQVPPPSPPN
jgi:hypothetical protein